MSVTKLAALTAAVNRAMIGLGRRPDCVLSTIDPCTFGVTVVHVRRIRSSRAKGSQLNLRMN